MISVCCGSCVLWADIWFKIRKEARDFFCMLAVLDAFGRFDNGARGSYNGNARVFPFLPLLRVEEEPELKNARTRSVRPKAESTRQIGAMTGGNMDTPAKTSRWNVEAAPR